MPEEVLTLCDVLEHELVSIAMETDLAETDHQYTDFMNRADSEVRPRDGKTYSSLRQEHRDAGEGTPENDEAKHHRLERLMQILRNQRRSALCFSGGGIRSATFCLGALQGMAHQQLIREFDYLSTVSGGGYIGSWLSSWLAGGGEPKRRKDIREVEKVLADVPGEKVDGELPQAGFLRSYSNYLSPQVGLLSVDSWTLASTVIRNMFLNWMILVPMLALALLIPYLALAVTKAMEHAPAAVLWALLIDGFGGAAWAVWNIGRNLPSIVGRGGCTQAEYLKKVLLPVVASAILMNAGWIGFYRSGTHFAAWQFSAFGALLHLVGWVGISPSGLANIRKAWAAGFALVSGAAGGWVGYLLADVLNPHLHPERATWLALPITLAIYYLATAFFIGLASKNTNDEDREWWARSGAWILMVTTGWLILGGLVIYGPHLLSGLWTSVVGAGGIASGWLGSLVGASSKTASGHTSPGKSESGSDGKGKAGSAETAEPGWLLHYGGKLAPVVFLLCLLLAVSKLANLIVTLKMEPFLRQIPELTGWLDPSVASVLALMAVLLLVAIIMSRYVNINTFSLHAMYRSRLIRAYLGASNTQREPNPFTGFDPQDNLPMHRLSPGRPFHVVNIALNLVRGKRLAWQQRKAETFTVTRLHAGSARVDYQHSAHYGDRDGIKLGTAMAISGAAASPNMGYHSSPLVTFLMTFFNARLGWWLPNPGAHGKGLWPERGPKSALGALLGEAFGLTDDENPYVYLSDGGHFENLGLYEMVLRRCHTIVVIDASADPNYEFEDLANAVRKIRVDLGVPIRLDKPMQMMAGEMKTNVHCVTGEIGYSCVDGAGFDGTLVYIKPVMDEWQSVDIDNYYASNRDFPQQTTADQFFDEAQFESYRRLGSETIERICEKQVGKATTLSEFVTMASAHSGKKQQAFRATF